MAGTCYAGDGERRVRGETEALSRLSSRALGYGGTPVRSSALPTGARGGETHSPSYLNFGGPAAAPGASERPGHHPPFSPFRPANTREGERTAPRPNTYGGPTLESHLQVPPPSPPPWGRWRAGSPPPLRLNFLPSAELVTGGPVNGAPGTATPTSQPHPLQRRPFPGVAEAPQRTEAQELSR
ncbi:hypothetical protein NDU88_003501 [Pleurodeles waltl]|uniref:Uncharacterized protein n=1 Tax=Pleurodeles waltl TaxID=8319 RepID=A0AAV7SGA6_PLEWA|nr:hypothetical protein NDU88_003501 [Pleurodeles waltl]